MPRVEKSGCKNLFAIYFRNFADSDEAVKKSALSIYAASRSYGIPYGTLYNKIHGLHMQKPGTSPVLTETQENELAEVVRVAGIWGFPLTPACIMRLVEQFKQHNIKIQG